jgi:hypothetical protein
MSIGQPIGVASESALRMELGNGSRIISMPGSERANVGYTANLCIIDEAGLTPSALLDALEPTVAATRGSIIALSAAYGARGWFYEQWNASDTDKVWERHIATADDSSVVTPEVVEIARLTRGERHIQSQYYCSFLHDETAYFKQEDLMRSLTLMNMEEEPMFPEACA